MGAYIVQDNKPVAFWSHKLNDVQLKYTVGDKELLSIVLVLTKFHLNITTNNIPDQVIQWLNYIEQFNPYIHFITGK